MKKALILEEQIYWDKFILDDYGKERLKDKKFKERVSKRDGTEEFLHSYILADLYRDIGSIYIKLHDDKKALEFYEKASNSNYELHYANSESTAKFCNEMSLLYFRLKEYDDAYSLQKEASRFFTKIKLESFKHMSYEEKKSFLNKNNYNMHNLLMMAFRYQKTLNPRERQQVIKEAFTSWLVAKGEISNTETYLMELKHYNRLRDKELTSKIEKLIEKRREYSNLWLSKYSYIDAFSKEQQKKLDRVKKEKESLEKYVAPYVNQYSISSGSVSMHNPNTLELSLISDNLNKNELYIDFARLDYNYYYFTINSKGELTFNALDGLSDTVDRQIKAYRDIIVEYGRLRYLYKKRVKEFNKLSKKEQIKKKSEHKQELAKIIKETEQANRETKVLGKRLYALLLKKISKRYSKLIISPDGLLNLLPFESLVTDSGKYLIEEKNIVYVLSGKELYKAREEMDIHDLSSKDVVSLSYINYKYKNKDVVSATSGRKGAKSTDDIFNGGNGLNLLKETKNEDKMMSSIFTKANNNFISFTKNNATKEVLYNLKSPQILHLSTHSFYGKEDKLLVDPLMKSALALAHFDAIVKDSDSRGIMSALEFSTLNLYRTELVFFSSCESGLGDRYNSEGVSGLNRGAKIAGAERVISTLWSVDEQESLRLSTKFYTYLVEHASKFKLGPKFRDTYKYVDALRATKLSMIEEHPFYWAGFVQYGLESFSERKTNEFFDKALDHVIKKQVGKAVDKIFDKIFKF